MYVCLVVFVIKLLLQFFITLFISLFLSEKVCNVFNAVFQYLIAHEFFAILIANKMLKNAF